MGRADFGMKEIKEKGRGGVQQSPISESLELAQPWHLGSFLLNFQPYISTYDYGSGVELLRD